MSVRKLSRILISILILTVSFPCFSAFAAKEENKWEKLSDNRSGLMSIAYRGNTASFPENSLEGIISAEEIGVDMVSVNIEKTKDGVFVLCEDENLKNICNSSKDEISQATYAEIKDCFLYDNSGKLTNYKMTSLEDALNATDGDIILILDTDPEDKDEIYDLVLSCEATERTALRFEESSKSIAEWAKSKSVVPNVIGIYDGNIIWNTIFHINRLSEVSSAVQFQSKNYFNVMYGSFVAKRYSGEGMARAIAPTYAPDLCGQRSDSVAGWSELISKGFSIIETNNLFSLVKYIERADELNTELSLLVEKAESIDTEIYSDVSCENLKNAVESARESINKGIADTNELENRYSALILAMNSLNLKDGEDSQKGALNITAGKVIAAVLVGAAILAGQIYVHKMQKVKQIKG